MTESVSALSTVEAEPAKGRHFLAVFFLSFMWGTFGVDRFYLGKIWTGVLKLLTFGGFGIWVLIDLVLIMSGAMRDKDGREMLEFARYKKFAVRTVLIFSIILGVTMLATGGAVIFTLYELFTNLQNSMGGLKDLLPSGANLPDITTF
jgi:hypothetical protein